MDASAHFRGKRMTIMGLGLLGRGVGDARYLAQCGAELIVTDLKTREQLAESVAQLEEFPNVSFVLGEHRLEDFRERNLILKSADVKPGSPFIAEAQAHVVPVRMSADLFAEIADVPVIGVTGTRGKSTTTQMVAAILEAAGKKVLLGGNVRGVSTLALLKEATPEHIAVLELDSWQCGGFGDAKISPHIAVFTTFYPDHLNYYKGDLDAYLADKANIFLYQKPGDTLVLGRQCSLQIQERFGDAIKARTVVAGEAELPSEWQLAIPGTHNRYNAALALAAARAFGVADEVSRRALEAFKGVPGRFELIAERNGVKIYNDTNATTPEATLVALAALPPERTVLIMGGSDKGLDMRALIVKLPNLKQVILLAGTGTERIREQLPAASMIYHTLSEAVADACAHAGPGDSVLFSPAFASFGMFKNEYDRGDQFNALIKAL